MASLENLTKAVNMFGNHLYEGMEKALGKDKSRMSSRFLRGPAASIAKSSRMMNRTQPSRVLLWTKSCGWDWGGRLAVSMTGFREHRQINRYSDSHFCRHDRRQSSWLRSNPDMRAPCDLLLNSALLTWRHSGGCADRDGFHLQG